MHDLDDREWSAAARRCGTFTLDVGLSVPNHVPSCLLPVGCIDSPTVSALGAPTVLGYLLAADAVGREAEIVEHGLRLLEAGRQAGWNGNELRPFSCLEANIVLQFPDEWPLVIEMFGGAALAADEMLGDFADLARPEFVAYDNLDQGWAMRVLVETTDIVVLDWDWEVPPTPESVRAIRLERSEVARQAETARARFQALHAALTAAIGLDLWNIPPSPELRPRRSAWAWLKRLVGTPPPTPPRRPRAS